MKQITTKLPEHVVESLDHVAAEQYNDNRSEAIRELIINALNDEVDEREQELQERIDDLKRENERLRAEKRTLIEDREERTELVRYVEDELSYREAGLGTRMKWWLFGKGKE